MLEAISYRAVQGGTAFHVIKAFAKKANKNTDAVLGDMLTAASERSCHLGAVCQDHHCLDLSRCYKPIVLVAEKMLLLSYTAGIQVCAAPKTVHCHRSDRYGLSTQT